MSIPKFRALEGGSGILSGATIHNIDEAGITYNYTGFLTANGTVIIMRTNKTGTEFRYFIGNDYDVDWAARTENAYSKIA